MYGRGALVLQRSTITQTITNFSPDQTSLTAQTFTSTKPASRPISRIIFSERSVATPEDFFGHEIHNIPEGARNFATLAKSLLRTDADFVKSKTKSIDRAGRASSFVRVGNGPNSAVKPGGALTIATRNPSLMPSFLIKGVP